MYFPFDPEKTTVFEVILFCFFGSLAVLAMIVLLAGCSHNPGGLTLGKKVKIGTAEYEASYMNGLNFLDVPRENSSWEIEINDQDGLSWDAETQTLKGVKKIKRTVGRQVTGYLVELAKESPEAAKVWLAGDRNSRETDGDFEKTEEESESTEKFSENAENGAEEEEELEEGL